MCKFCESCVLYRIEWKCELAMECEQGHQDSEDDLETKDEGW